MRQNTDEHAHTRVCGCRYAEHMHMSVSGGFVGLYCWRFCLNSSMTWYFSDVDDGIRMSLFKFAIDTKGGSDCEHAGEQE